jgi:hypothetical protein
MIDWDKPWINWNLNPPQEDTRGFYIKYDDESVYPDEYDFETGKRAYKPNVSPICWRFIERPRVEKTFQPIIRN